jgi:hypothetical protein
MGAPFLNLVLEVDELELTCWCFNQRTERLHPISAVVVNNAVQGANLWFMYVATNNPVISTSSCIFRHVMLKMKNEVGGTFKVLFNVLGE